MQRGLQDSIWASAHNGNSHSLNRPGDWECPTCGFSNFQWRAQCFRCPPPGTPQGQVFVGSTTGQQNMTKTYDKMLIELENQVSNAHREPPTASGVAEYPTKPRSELEPGLSTSRWAPRNYNGRSKNADPGEVWIRRVPTVHDVSNRDKYNPNPSISKTPDLGLPYEVQHYILVMVQRMLEEGSYEFALRWIPGTLNDHNWSCAEAVELSTWRKFLPTALPSNAIVPVPGYSLDQALVDAVKIRNSATHRHLCDNFEIKRMALQAQDLMKMFSDMTRQSKFYQLWVALNDWDQASRNDADGARKRLEMALQEISERPVDNMDWTPNAVSLQQIPSGVETTRDTEDTIDQMEVD